VPAVQVLGRRHAVYGITDAHCAIVGVALLWTLEHGLRDGGRGSYGTPGRVCTEGAAILQQAGTVFARALGRAAPRRAKSRIPTDSRSPIGPAPARGRSRLHPRSISL
jgi:hypothetical protein